MVYFDEKKFIGGKEVIVKRKKKARDVSPEEAFKFLVVSKFLERPGVILVKEKIKEIRYRYGIPLIGERYLKRLEEGVYRFKGGRYYKIDPEKLLRRIEERGMSIGEFCRRVGISRRNFYNYLKGQMVQEENYEKMVEILGDIKEEDISEILKPREFRFCVEVGEEVRKAFEIVKNFFESYILGNEFVDLCVKARKRVIVKIGECEEIEGIARELESQPLIIKKPEEIKIVMMNY